MKKPISVVKYISSPESLKESIEKCNGFEKLKPSDTVMIKPNLVAWDDVFPFAPFGVYTTTRLVQDLIICLKDYGCSKIVVGEGSVQIKKNVGTMAAFEGLGYKNLEKRYGITLVDFNESKVEKVAHQDGIELHIAKEALENDFFINFPVLKTHGQTKVSLGLKNLKGCLNLKSKRHCHSPETNLEFAFSHIVDFVNPALSIIDGIYALERGALHFGNAFRKDLIIASQDALGADLVAAKIIGYDGKQINHFGHYGKRHHKSLAVEDYKIEGETIKKHIQPLKWDWVWTKDNTGPGIFEKMGIKGTAIPKYDSTLCSGCSPLANMINLLVISAFKGEPLPSVEILNGKKMKPRPGYDKTMLLGNCMIKQNKDDENIREAFYIKGCPPSEQEVVKAMELAGLDVNVAIYHGYLKQQSEKYKDREEFESKFFIAA
jgi:uncharacterized protein (DUF362 family)